MNRKEAGIDSDILRTPSRKIDSKKRQLPITGNRRNKNTYYSADLDGTIILIDSHTPPEEGQDFFCYNVNNRVKHASQACFSRTHA